jgi:outer membrane protein assembly factor BamB
LWRKQIFLTCPTNDLDAVFAFSWDGKVQWDTTFGPQSPGAHRNGSGSNPSPVTDGKVVVVRFKSGTVAGLGLDSHVLWQTNLTQAFGPENLYWDQGTSPVLVGNKVIVARMHGGDSFLAAFDELTGKLIWKVARDFQTPVEGDHAYTTPLIIQERGHPAILVWGAQHLTAHDPVDGKLLWTCGNFNPQAVPNWPAVASPIVASEVAIVACGRADRGQPRLYGVRLGGAGDVTASNRLWERTDTGTFVPTPTVWQDHVYLLRDRGEVECLDPQSGKTLWKDAFPKSSHNFYASPVIAGGNLYAAREDGVVFVARVQNKFEVISESALGEQIIASPVAVGARLLLRGEHHLFCFTATQSSRN